MTAKRIHVPLSPLAAERLKKILSDANAEFYDGRVVPGEVISLLLESAKLDVAVLRLRATRAHLVLKRLLKDGTSADPVKAAEQLQIIAAKLRQIGRSGGTKDDEAGHGKS